MFIEFLALNYFYYYSELTYFYVNSYDMIHLFTVITAYKMANMFKAVNFYGNCLVFFIKQAMHLI